MPMRQYAYDFSPKEKAKYNKAKDHKQSMTKKCVHALRKMDNRWALSGKGLHFYTLTLFQARKYSQSEAIPLDLNTETDIKTAHRTYVGPMS